MKRLQVVMSESELEAYHRAARAQGLTLSAWVRRTLADARRTESEQRIRHKLRAIEEAGRWNAPTGDPEQMLAEIEAGRLDD